MTILLTGASGFVGKAVLKAAQERGITIRPVYRKIEAVIGVPNAVWISETEDNADWTQALNDVDVLIHAAGLTQITRIASVDSLNVFRRVNVQGTLNLARQAAAAGVRRFVFISSIKVNGESTAPGQPFTADDIPAPEDAYGQSKIEAEVHLNQVAKETGMEVTIIRPPLIYGPGVKGNFASLIMWVRRGLPMPLGAVDQNRRSLVGLDNLVDLILLCAYHPKAAHQVFLISDGEDLSTTDLIRRIGKALRQPVRLFWVPLGLLSFMAALIGKKAFSKRLLGSLEVDIQKTCELLDWKPSVVVDEGLSRAVERI
jgi:nucleoside-diphosphate-sugar epimerase